MKYYLGFLLAVIIVFGGVYLGICFVQWDIVSIIQWEPSYRFLYLMVWLILTAPVTGLIFNIIEG